MIAVSLHSEIAFDAGAEELRLFASRDDEAPRDFIAVVFSLSVAHPERGRFFGLAEDVRDSVVIPSDW